MGRTIVTSVNTCTLYGAYKCSKCGKIVKFNKIVNSTAEASRGGLVYDKEKLSPLFASTEREASLQIGPQVYNELKAVESKDYKKAYLHCSCNCGNKEIWASFIPTIGVLSIERPFLARTLLGALFFGSLASLLLIILAITEKESSYAIIAGVIWACILLFIPIRNHFNQKTENRCLSISEESRPHLFVSQEKRDIFAETLLLSAQKTVSQSSIERVTQESEVENQSLNNVNALPDDDTLVFCYKCGNKLRPGSVFCSKCGTKLR